MKVYLTAKEINIIRKVLKILYDWQKCETSGSNKDFSTILFKLNKTLNDNAEKVVKG